MLELGVKVVKFLYVCHRNGKEEKEGKRRKIWERISIKMALRNMPIRNGRYMM